MAVLTGSLETFTLPDVFRLLARNTVSGALHVERDSGDGIIYFRDGQIYFAYSSLTREFLGQRLVGAKIITQGQLLRVLDEQKRTGNKRLGDLLIEKGFVADDLLSTFIREQIQDAIFNLLQWDAGNFSFEVAEESAEEVGLSVSVENLIMESSRRIEEWEVIHRKIPNLDVVLAMSPTPPDETVEINIKPEEWTLLVLADGVRTVSEIAAATGRSDFDAAKILYGLVTAGLLDVGGVPSTPEEKPRQRAKKEEIEEPVEEAEIEEEVTLTAVPSGSEEAGEERLPIDASALEPSEDWAVLYQEGETQVEAVGDQNGEVSAEVTPEPEAEMAMAGAGEDPTSTGGGSKGKAEAAVSKEVLMRLIAGVRNL